MSALTKMFVSETIRTSFRHRFVGEALGSLAREVPVALLNRRYGFPEHGLADRAFDKLRQVALLCADPRQIAPNMTVRLIRNDEVTPSHRKPVWCK